MTQRSLGPVLEQVYREYHSARWLGSDPLELVHRYTDPWDQEAAALACALFAYGNVRQIRASLHTLLGTMEASGGPAAFVRAPKRFSGFAHRLHNSQDALALFRLLGRSWEKYGSLGAHLTQYLQAQDTTFAGALSMTLRDWKLWVAELPEPPGPWFLHLLSSPADGSCCKRWCMLMRWMVRKDELDLGLWSKGSPLLPAGPGFGSHQLVMPLDTHTGALAQLLDLTRRKSLNWKAAVEITENLRKFDPVDPVRFDFSLCRLGILDLCHKKWVPDVCQKCALKGQCRFTRRRAVC